MADELVIKNSIVDLSSAYNATVLSFIKTYHMLSISAYGLFVTGEKMKFCWSQISTCHSWAENNVLL
jgi:hypothetical protein